MDLHLDLDRAPGGTLRARTEHALREAVRGGRLLPGTRLPATRALATELGVSRGVVVEAYAQLAAEGYLDTRRGGGTRVAGSGAAHDARPAGGGMVATGAAAGAPLHRGANVRGAVPPARFDMRPALPSVDGFPRQAWLGALTRVLRTLPDERLGYGDRRGEPELRTALAASLARRRGVRATPDQILVTGGLRDSLPLVWRLLRQRGARRVGVEDPGWWRIGRSAQESGLTPVPVPTDDDGLRPDALADVQAVAVTPAHQFPTGAVLSPARRAALVAYARAHDAFVLEDDYDAEFRYDRQPIGSLQGLAPDLVIYGGSCSKTLAPALRLGWLVLPSTLTRNLHDDDPASPAGTPPPLDQLALADLIERGEVDRHLRRQRLRYRKRRDALLAELATQLPGFPVRGAAAGLFAVLLLPDGADEQAIAERAADGGVALEPLRAPGRAGLVIGYANLPEPSAPAAVRALARALT
ncbi:HTH-type transcriptional regulatory protein GabR [Baekduia alba]|uniref:MocR-like pyridoxine biosynthesis transcription factor PdxR n=1 Tax=Baekduia alba TaxID=2997333 RepID=UPI00233FC98D|nr:PLP-dependent aminotransferase family protein [Baekduia alba]WCB92341.1 HTH-type transcriptional regulatory protein GabR [Baekduia alba]